MSVNLMLIRRFGTKNRVSVGVGPINGRIQRNTDGIRFPTPAERPPQTANIDYEALNLKFPMKLPVKFVVGHWAPKPEVTPSLPFEVERSAYDTIPVYTDYKNGGKVITMLRKCKGDIEVLKEEMEKVCGTAVEVRPGKLIVTGNFSKRLKTWLIGLGF